MLFDPKVTPEGTDVLTCYGHSGRIIGAIGNRFDPAR